MPVLRRREGAKPVSASGISALLALLLVLVGAIVLQNRQSSEFEFARALPAYHQLVGDDIRSGPGSSEASMIGRYTTEPSAEGEQINIDALGPQLSTDSIGAEDVILAIPSLTEMATVAQPGDVFMVQAQGSSTRICPIRVVAIESTKDAPSRVVAAVSRSAVRDFNRVENPEVLVALRVWGFSQGATEPSSSELCA